MQIVVFGSTDLTLSVVEFLYNNSYKISAIVTVPQIFKISYKPEGVNNIRFIDLNAWGAEKGISVINYTSVDQVIAELHNLKVQPEFAIVVGWYHMVPQKLRDIFPKGCSGFHASLLPKLRGGAPLNWAILLGLKETGVSFFELSDGVDDGLLYDQEKFLIESTDTIEQLIQKSEISIIKMLKRFLLKIQIGDIKKYPQQGTSSYCGQRVPEDSQINWNQPAETILRLIKASSKPYAGAYSFLDKEKITIWEAELSDVEIYGIPGQIINIDEKIYIICNDGALSLKNVENRDLLTKSNHKRMN